MIRMIVGAPLYSRDIIALGLKSLNKGRMEALIVCAEYRKEQYIESLRSDFDDWYNDLPMELERLCKHMTAGMLPAGAEQHLMEESCFTDRLFALFPCDKDEVKEEVLRSRSTLNHEAHQLLQALARTDKQEVMIQAAVLWLEGWVEHIDDKLSDMLGQIDEITAMIMLASDGYSSDSLLQIRAVIDQIDKLIDA